MDVLQSNVPKNTAEITVVICPSLPFRLSYVCHPLKTFKCHNIQLFKGTRFLLLRGIFISCYIFIRFRDLVLVKVFNVK